MKARAERRIGIWLDHSKAHFVDLSNGGPVLETLYSDKESNTRYPGESSDGTRLSTKRNRVREQMQLYYKVLVDRLKTYDDIYLFGPTTAKDELYNRLKSDKHFADKVINIASEDHPTEKQLVAKVRRFFNM